MLINNTTRNNKETEAMKTTIRFFMGVTLGLLVGFGVGV